MPWQNQLFQALEPFPEVMTKPPVVNVTVVPPPNYVQTVQGDLDPYVQEIVEHYRASIIQFCMAQRHAANLGTLDMYGASLNFPQLEIHFQRLQGFEQINLRVHPVLPEKEDDKMMLVLYETNKVAAIDMRSVKGDGLTVRYQAQLKKSSWGEDIFRTAQYTFDTTLGGLIFSPFYVDSDNIIHHADTHYLTQVKAEIRQFLTSSTPKLWTPHINGSGDDYFTSNDHYQLQDHGSGKQLTYIGLYGHVGNGAAPYVIAPNGAYYYAPVCDVQTPVNVLAIPGSPHEQSVTARTDSYIDNYATQAEANHQPPVPRDGHFLNFSAEQAALYAIDLGWYAFSGYGTFVSGVYEYSLLAAYDNPEVTTGDVRVLGPSPPANISTCGPVTTTVTNHTRTLNNVVPTYVYSQKDGVDKLDIELVPFLADAISTIYSRTNTMSSMDGFTTFAQDYGSSVEDSLGSFTYFSADFSFSEHIVGSGGYTTYFKHFITPETWEYFSFTPGTTVNTTIENPPRNTQPDYDPAFPFPGPTSSPHFVWLLSYPPSFGSKTSQVYHAALGYIKTPYDVILTYSYPNPEHNHAYKMREQFKPWFHLSNGDVCFQGFETQNGRHVWRSLLVNNEWKRTDFMPSLTKALNTTADKIQAIFLDIPLKRIREFA